MKKKLLYVFLAIGIGTAVAEEPTINWCIVGGTRGIGYADARNICNDPNARCTLFVRPDSEKKAKDLMQDTTTPPTVITGDVTTDLAALTEAAQGASYLVIAQTFPYTVWADSYPAMVANCIAAARQVGATIVHYCRLQRYGMVNPILEDSIAQPVSDQGTILDAAAQLLQSSGVPTIIINHGTPFGPQAGDGLLDDSLSKIPFNKGKSWYQAKQKFDWIGTEESAANIRFQFAYLPDLAAFTRQVAATTELTSGAPCLTINFAGITVTNINEFGQTYCNLANVPYELNLYSKSTLTTAAFFKPEAKRGVDSYYAFINEILLDDTLQKALYPFELTSLETALQETYNAYAAAH